MKNKIAIPKGLSVCVCVLIDKRYIVWASLLRILVSVNVRNLFEDR